VTGIIKKFAVLQLTSKQNQWKCTTGLSTLSHIH